MTPEQIWEEAEAEALASARACVPEPMVVTSRTATEQKIYYVPQGVCGFASIRFAGNTAFGRWAKRVGHATPAYGGGLAVHVHEGGQSYEIKCAYARAFSGVLNENGIESRVESFLD